MKLYKIFSLLVTVLLLSTVAEPIIITNSSTTSLEKATLKKIFLGKKKKFDGGEKVVLSTLTKGTSSDEFMTKFVNKKYNQFTVYWKQIMFTGRGVMPKSFNSDKELIDFVAKTSGAIGYISDGTLTLPSGVTVIQLK